MMFVEPDFVLLAKPARLFRNDDAVVIKPEDEDDVEGVELISDESEPIPVEEACCDLPLPLER